MNVHDEMSDSEVLSTASDCLARMPVADAPDMASIMAKGGARRRNRLSALAGLSVAGVAAGFALVLGLTGALGPAGMPGTIRTASFTLVSNSSGTTTLTINPKELLDPTALQNDLAQFGISAKVTTGSLCSSDPAPPGFSQIVTSNLAGPDTATPQSVPYPSLTIDLSAIPAGTELSVGVFQVTSGTYSGQQQADFLLIDTSAYTCSSTPPGPLSLPDGYGPDDGIGLLYDGPSPTS